uniref:ERF1_1 domain-containing protein n=1 Tax=Panagrellus redivivus TaxID=6233 RepID=A0A7E4W2Q3_PANRE
MKILDRKLEEDGSGVRCELEIVVTDVGFDPLFKGIRFEGFTETATEYVDKGWGHTLEIGLNHPFKLTKRRWLPIDDQRIESSLEIRTEDSLAAVVLHDGVAQIYIVQRNMTFVKATVNMQVARKRSGFGSGHEKSVQEFLETAAKSFMRHIEVDDVKAVILAGRGFIHNNFWKTLFNVADQINQPYNNTQNDKHNMKILDRKLEEDGSGFVQLICDTQDDFWQMLNIVRKGDRIKAWTSRKIKELGQRVRCELEIVVTDVGFDPLFKGIRFEGFTETATEYVDKGWGHTLEIGLNQPFKLTKRRWLPIDAQRIKSSLEIRTEHSLAAVVLHEGVAQIYIVQRNMTFTKATVNMQVARKRSGFGSGHEKSVQEFLETAAKSFMRHIKVDDVKAVILAGRGFIHNNFRKTLFNVADQINQPYNNTQKDKFVLVNVSSGYKHSIKEILSNLATSAALAHTVAKDEVKALDKFMGMVMNDPSRAFYGYKHVAMANEHVAIDTLLISDALLRSDNVHERK